MEKERLNMIEYKINPCTLCKNNVFNCENIETCQQLEMWKEYTDYVKYLIQENEKLKKDLMNNPTERYISQLRWENKMLEQYYYTYNRCLNDICQVLVNYNIGGGTYKKLHEKWDKEKYENYYLKKNLNETEMLEAFTDINFLEELKTIYFQKVNVDDTTKELITMLHPFKLAYFIIEQIYTKYKKDKELIESVFVSCFSEDVYKIMFDDLLSLFI